MYCPFKLMARLKFMCIISLKYLCVFYSQLCLGAGFRGGCTNDIVFIGHLLSCFVVPCAHTKKYGSLSIALPHPYCYLIIRSFIPPALSHYRPDLLPIYSPCVCSPVSVCCWSSCVLESALCPESALWPVLVLPSDRCPETNILQWNPVVMGNLTLIKDSALLAQLPEKSRGNRNVFVIRQQIHSYVMW